jgi:Phosphotransferase enzyme family
VAIPTTVEELTPAWLSEALGATVDEVEVLDAHSGTTGRARLRVRGPSGLPDTVFVKLQPFLPEQRQFLRATGLGVAEARLYAAVGSELPVRVPRVWHSSFDEAEAQFVMVLEDLVASGCRFPGPDDPDIVAVATSLFDELALLHATYWDQELPWLGTHVLSTRSSKQQRKSIGGATAIVQSALDQFAADMPPAFRALGELYAARSREVAALWNEGTSTLIHGDDHIGNLLVDGGRTGFFDWAVASRFPGMRDVAYFLANSLPTEVRRAEEDTLLARYRKALAGHGIELAPELQREQYRLFAVYSWISATTTAAMGSRWQPAEVARVAMERTTQAVIDLDVLGLLGQRLG